MTSPVLTLYYSSMSPWCQRLRILLKESDAKYEEILIDLKNKPEYFKELNPLLEVPAITYGSPSEKDGQPSPDAFKLYESSVIAEFIADLYPTSSILPKDPVAKAKVRFFVDLAAKKLIPSLGAIAFAGASYQSVLGHIEKTQSLLDPKLNFFAGDKITLADAVLAPFFCSLHLMAGPRFSLKEDGEMAKLLNALKEDKYSTFLKYLETLASHPTVKGTFDEEGFVEQWKDAPI